MDCCKPFKSIYINLDGGLHAKIGEKAALPVSRYRSSNNKKEAISKPKNQLFKKGASHPSRVRLEIVRNCFKQTSGYFEFNSKTR